MPDSNAIYPFHLSIPQSELDDLQTRLRLTRWPDKETVSDDSQGVPLATMKELCLYWQNEYNWRKCEDLLNSYPQFTTTIDGVEIYFLHIRSKHENALPMLLTHGWPGSVLEFRHVIDKLIDPEDPEDAFHLIIPALPGYAFSGKPTETGWGIKRTAKAWVELMSRLGYTEASWVAQGGDWGAHISACLGNMAPKGLKAIHLNSIFLEPKVCPLLSLPHSHLSFQTQSHQKTSMLNTSIYRKKSSPQPKTKQARTAHWTSTPAETSTTTATTRNKKPAPKPSATVSPPPP